MSSKVPLVGEVLPPRARLLHVGLPKTGTTSLQQAAANNREALLRHGVRYPGTAVSHRMEFAALMGRDTLWTAQGPVFPTRRAWDSLLAEIEADGQRRVLVSHESASACDDAQAVRFRDELGPRLHVVVTVRNFPEMLSSRWQQYVKSGMALSFSDWLEAVLADRPEGEVTPGFRSTSDQGAIVERWCRVLGPQRVTVVVTDKSQPRLLAHAIGGLLGVPPDLLQVDPTSRSTNRSLSAAEAELIRGLNAVVRRDPRLWSRHQDLVRSGVVRRLQSARKPSAAEPALRLPTWAATSACGHGRRHAEQIAATGCRVLGDLSQLHAPVPVVTDVAEPQQVPIEAALEALLGMMRASARPAPRGAVGRPLGPDRYATRWGVRLGRMLPAHRMPPALRRHVQFIRRARRGLR